METLESAFRKRGSTLNPLRVTVVKVKEADDGLTLVALADRTGSALANCYSADVAKLLKGAVMLKMYRVGQVGRRLLLNEKTKVSVCGPQQISDLILKEAANLVDPPPLPTTTISDILEKTETGYQVSIEGTIVQDEVAHTAGNGAMVRNIKIADSTGEIKVALWRKTSLSPVKTGQYVKLERLAVRRDNLTQIQGLQSIGATLVKEVAVEATEVDVELVAVDDMAEHEITFTALVAEKCTTLVVKRANIEDVLDGYVHDVDCLAVILPLNMKGKVAGTACTLNK